MRPEGMRVILGLFALVFVLAGCGNPADVSAGSPQDQPSLEASAEVKQGLPARPVPSDSVGVAMSCPGPLPDGMNVQQAPLPDGFVTTWVFRCRQEVRPKPGEGEWNYQILERADTDAKALVEQLRRPSDPMSNQPCTLEMRMPPYFALVDATGKAVMPPVPTDGCGKPRIEVFKLLEALQFRVLSETPTSQVVTQKSADSGCPDAYKDLTTFDNVVSHDAPVGPVWADPVSALRVCIYASPGNEPGRAGKLMTTRVVDGDAAKTLVAQFNEAPPAVTCDLPHTSFATVSPMRTPNAVQIELDGCLRMVRPDNTLVQLNEGVVAALTAR